MALLKTLYITYDGINDPLGKSQILPYLKRLGKKGFDIFLLSFEKDGKQDFSKVKELKKELEAFNIYWTSIKFHRGSLAAKLWDLILGVWFAAIIVRKNRINAIHARGHFPAFVPLVLKKFFSVRFIFDMRGLWVEEKVDAGVFPMGGLRYRFVKWFEEMVLLSANEIIVLTQSLKDRLTRLPHLRDRAASISVIPTCVDLELFYPTNGSKKDDKLFEGKFVISYFGSIGTYYNFVAVLDFYKTLLTSFKNAYLLIMSNTPLGAVRKIIESNGVLPERYHLGSVSYEDVPRWLRASDVSLIFYNRRYSRAGCCPTKFAEYLACGLPVVINSGIGDANAIIKKYKLGAVIDGFNEKSYLSAISELSKIMKEKDVLSDRCHRIARELFSLESGVSKYFDVYNKLRLN